MNCKFLLSIATLRVSLLTLIFSAFVYSQTLAPGAPGKDAQWSSAGKQAIGTSASLESKVWFTLQGGALTEVYYPDVTVANVHKLEFVVVNPKTKKVETETADANHEIKPLRVDSLTFQQINTAKSGEWKITKTYTTDPERDSVLIDVKFEPKNRDFNLYVYYDPSLGNTGMHDFASRKFGTGGDKIGNLIVENDKPHIASVLGFSSEIAEQTNGFYQISDGLEQLKQFGKITKQYDEAPNGNVVQMAKIVAPKNFTVVLSFAQSSWAKAFGNKIASLKKGFAKCLAEYEKGWSDYVKTIPKVEPKYQAQFNMAAMVLKAQEDKTVRGANVASLTIPWGGGANANEDIGGGYHLVWSRDLYQVFTAYMALGDTAAANRALAFLFNIQQKPDGSFPQNSWLDGRCGWCSLQMDEVAYPLIMAYQLKRFDRKTYDNHVKKAADFIVKTGPRTEQERWEEEAGFSPSTIAAEIAGLVCAADIAKRNNDETSANLYLETADEWQANVEKWTVTTNGKYSKEPYYVRITGNGKPDAGEKIELNNGAGFFDEREIVDAGFLELVRLGIKSPDDKIIRNSLKVVDEVLRVNTPNGESFYRYNHDGYGEMEDGRRWNWDGKYTGKGRLWALLTGERGQYELALSPIENKLMAGMQIDGITSYDAAIYRLDSMLKFANDGLMIAEQIWDKPQTPKNIDEQFVPELKFGESTGSATPLAWSMAQFIRLAVNLQAGKNLDTPDIVYERYVLGKKSEANNQNSLETENKKVEITASCYSDWSDKNREKVLQQSPIILSCKDGVRLPIFVYSGKGENVEVVGDFTGWKPQKLILTRYQPYAPVEGDFLEFSRFYALQNIASSARVEYKLIVDGKWINDPLNPNKVDNGVGGENSFFTMPDYKPTIWDKERIANIDGFGKVKTVPNFDTFEIDSKIYGKRGIKVYQPTNEKGQLPTLYLQDGTDYINRAKAIQIQQNLVAAKKIKPFIMVFLDPKDRMKEYWADDDYAKFLATEVVPMLDKQYKTIKSRDGRAILGASLGGVTSVHTAIKYPEIFGRVGGQSSSFWIDNERVIKELETLDAAKNKFVFYFDVGTLEGADDDRKAVGILRKKGFDVTYQEAETGHNWMSWRDRLADAFVALWSDAKM